LESDVIIQWIWKLINKAKKPRLWFPSQWRLLKLIKFISRGSELFPVQWNNCVSSVTRFQNNKITIIISLRWDAC
jgi:hypothetical protein